MNSDTKSMLEELYKVGTPAEKAAFILGLSKSVVKKLYLNQMLDLGNESENFVVRSPKAERGLYERSRKIADKYLGVENEFYKREYRK